MRFTDVLYDAEAATRSVDVLYDVGVAMRFADMLYDVGVAMRFADVLYDAGVAMRFAGMLHNVEAADRLCVTEEAYLRLLHVILGRRQPIPESSEIKRRQGSFSIRGDVFPRSVILSEPFGYAQDRLRESKDPGSLADTVVRAGYFSMSFRKPCQRLSGIHL